MKTSTVPSAMPHHARGRWALATKNFRAVTVGLHGLAAGGGGALRPVGRSVAAAHNRSAVTRVPHPTYAHRTRHICPLTPRLLPTVRDKERGNDVDAATALVRS